MKVMVSNADFVTFVDGTVMSRQKFDEEYRVCQTCGEASKIADMYRLNNPDEEIYVCENCRSRFVKICHGCGYEIIKQFAYRASDTGHFYCSNCFENGEISECQRCGDYYDERIRYYDDCDSCLCDACREEHLNENLIGGYHRFKNRGNYHFYESNRESKKLKNKPLLYFGFELEVDHGGLGKFEMVKCLKEVFGDYIQYERDGSLEDQEHAFEMISHPATIEWMEENRPMFEKAFKLLSDNGYSSHNTNSCGLHVHVSRKFFEYEDRPTERILYIFNKFWKELVIFSRRKENKLKRWAGKYYSPIKQVVKAEKSILQGNHDERYHAVNLTNRNTIEFRMARGTLKLSTFFATIKLYNNICLIVKHTPISKIEKMSWEDIMGNDEEIKNYWNERMARLENGGEQ